MIQKIIKYRVADDLIPERMKLAKNFFNIYFIYALIHLKGNMFGLKLQVSECFCAHY